jgi:hypothetical protein
MEDSNNTASPQIPAPTSRLFTVSDHGIEQLAGFHPPRQRRAIRVVASRMTTGADKGRRERLFRRVPRGES